MINVRTDHLNGVPIHFEKTSFRLTNDELNTIFGKSYYHPMSNHLTKTSFLLKDDKLSRIKSFLDERMNSYIENIVEINDKFIMTQSWSTTTKKSENHHLHSHHNSIFSLVFYVSSEGKKSGNLVFDFKYSKLMERMYLTYDVKNYNTFNSTTWEYEVNTGDLIIFPAWIYHETRENTSDEDRVIIGANYFVEGIIGTTEGVDKIQIRLGDVEDD